MPVHIHYLTPPYPFDFVETVTAHGWYALAPFQWDPRNKTLETIHHLSDGTIISITMSGGERSVGMRLESGRVLRDADLAEARATVGHMLRIDEDLSAFHRKRKEMTTWDLTVTGGGGRLLRAPTFFQDVVCTLCTTNISWSGTKRMVAALVDNLGTPFPVAPNKQAFPTAEQILQAGEEALKEMGLGYRAGYVYAFAQATAAGEWDDTDLWDPAHATEELQKRLLTIKGVGNYAAATLLMVLGRYDYLAIDSELRAHVSRKYLNGEKVTKSKIRAIYDPWGPWRYLAYWFDRSD